MKNQLSRRSFVKRGMLWLPPAIFIPRLIRANPFMQLMNGGVNGMAFSALGSNGGSTTGASSYATGSYTPTVNALVLAVVVNTKASAPDTPTFSGNGLTWVQLVTQTYNTIASPLSRLTVFRALGASPTATAGTADFAGANQTGGIVRVVQFTGVDTSGTNGSGAVVQSPSINRADATTNPTLTMSAISSANNAVIGFAAHDANSTTYGAVETADWTEDTELSYNTPATGLVIVYRLRTTDNSITVTGASGDWAVAGVEVKAL